jgi:hypothetical protein
VKSAVDSVQLEPKRFTGEVKALVDVGVYFFLERMFAIVREFFQQAVKRRILAFRRRGSQQERE